MEAVDGDRYATWDAAYVLGSLSSAERREFEAHLETCPRCREAVADISGMPALLAMLDVDDVRALSEEQPEVPPLRPEVLEGVLDKVRWRRRRSRLLTSAAVGLAAALLAVGLVIAVRPGIVGLQSGTAADDGAGTADGQARADAVQRHHCVEQFRMGHPHRHGLHVRSVVGRQ